MCEGEKKPEINRLGVMAFLEKRNKAQEEIKRSNAEMLKAVRALKKNIPYNPPKRSSENATEAFSDDLFASRLITY